MDMNFLSFLDDKKLNFQKGLKLIFMNFECARVEWFEVERRMNPSIELRQKTTEQIIIHPFLTNSIIFRLCLVINLISRSFHNLRAHQKTRENNDQHIIYLRYLTVKHINK